MPKIYHLTINLSNFTTNDRNDIFNIVAMRKAGWKVTDEARVHFIFWEHCKSTSNGICFKYNDLFGKSEKIIKASICAIEANLNLYKSRFDKKFIMEIKYDSENQAHS
jgi:hypothetical protein